jgi:hypothetical protein
MKINIFSITVVMLFLSQIVISQDILTVIEKDRDGRYLDKHDSVKGNYINNRIADINSVLEIKIDHSALAGRLSNLYQKRLPDELSRKISALLAALKTRNQSLTRINEIINRYDYNLFKSDLVAYDQYISDLQQSAAVIYEIKQIDPRIKKEAIKYEDPDDMFNAVYYAAETILGEMTNEIEDFAEEEGVRIQIGGWLVTKNENIPIHLEGFDDIAPQSPYEVERWQFIPTQDQLKELEDIQELAKKNRDLGTSILKTIAQNQLLALKAFGKSRLDQMSEKLETEFQRVKSELGQAIDPELAQALDSIGSLKTDLSKFIRGLDERLDYYRNITVVNPYEINSFISHAMADLSFITAGDGLKLKVKIESTGKQLARLDQAMLGTIASLDELVNGLKEEYIAGFKSMEAIAKNKAEEFLVGRALDIKALEFGNDVYKLTLANLPESTELDLINTGVRNDGDRLALKMAVSDKSSSKPVILDTREIYLFRVLPHVISTVGVVFADPLANTAIKTQFQMAPSYNILFKGIGDQKARRRSVIYNRLFDWGFGLHLAAPDFDKDDVPELTAGVVVSCLHDYLQSGFAFNLFTGDPYWFFGLRFPIPTFSMGAASKVQVE